MSLYKKEGRPTISVKDDGSAGNTPHHTIKQEDKQVGFSMFVIADRLFMPFD
jgi:hypothetical protein